MSFSVCMCLSVCQNMYIVVAGKERERKSKELL